MELHTSTTGVACEIVPGVMIRTRCGWFAEVMASAHRLEDHQVHFEYREVPPEVYSEFELVEIELCPPEL